MKPFARFRAALALALVLVPLVAAAQAPDLSAVDALALAEMKDTSVPGAAITIVSGGRVVYVKAYGVASVETGAPVTPDMLFRLGSTTKMFTATALALLAEQGSVDLTKPIGSYIKGLHPSIARLTGHQLLSHTSGILDEAPMFGSQDESSLMRNVLTWTEDRFFTEPGRIYSYSNPGFWLAGALIEAVSGKLYADQMHDSVFEPLGMTRTTLRPMVAITYPLAHGHDESPSGPAVARPAANNAASWPAGSIFSNVHDLSRFVMAFVGGGRLDGKQVLPAAVIARLSTPATKIPGSDSEYGYGLNIGMWRNIRVVQHGGARSGYGSTIRMVPDRQSGVIIVANRTGASLPRTAEKAMEILLSLPAAPADSAVQNASPMPPLTEQEAAAYAGVYSQGTRKTNIVAKGGKLFLKSGERETEIRRTGPHRFTSNVFFVAAADGRIEYLHMGGRSWKKIS